MLGVVVDLQERLYGEGRAERTVREYVKWARRLARWCVLHDLDLEALEAHHIRAWIDQTVPAGRESRKQAHTACRHLFTMLGRDDRPWEAIVLPRKRKGNPQPLTEPERVRLRDAAILVGGRQGVATLGLLQTAARPSEVAGWRWDGIDWDAGTIRFYRSKVRDWHTVPLRPALAEALERFRGPFAEGFVFVGDRGRPHVTPATIWTWVRKVAEVAGVEDVKPRRLRATAIGRALEATGDIDAAAELAGHSSPDTTRTYYTRTSSRRLLAASAALD